MPRRRPAPRPRGLPSTLTEAVHAALTEYGLDSAADRLLGVAMEALAKDADAAADGRQRAAAVKSLLEVADRLDLVPPMPGRSSGGGGSSGRAAPPPAPAEPAAADDGEDPDNPFGVPGTWPRAVP